MARANRYDFEPSGLGDPVAFLSEPIIDDPELEDYNVRTRVDGFIKAVQNQACGFNAVHSSRTRQ